ncbi:hypothetical protein [Pedobacter sp. UYP1]|uniref:hypothetical protein n=1 Tax=Pedobacter sp. UYP1 TaxID=1756396 RepID=UPI00339408FB
MDSNIIRLNLGSLIVCAIISCTNNSGKSHSQVSKKQEIDTCDLKPFIGSNIENKVGCENCHRDSERRIYPEVLTYTELSATDSLKLSDFIFKTKHNNLYIKEPMLRDHGNKKLDSLTECQRRSLIHYLKDHNRNIPIS